MNIAAVRKIELGFFCTILYLLARYHRVHSPTQSSTLDLKYADVGIVDPTWTLDH
jgi:hypothetical protein